MTTRLQAVSDRSAMLMGDVDGCRGHGASFLLPLRNPEHTFGTGRAAGGSRKRPRPPVTTVTTVCVSEHICCALLQARGEWAVPDARRLRAPTGATIRSLCLT